MKKTNFRGKDILNTFQQTQGDSAPSIWPRSATQPKTGQIRVNDKVYRFADYPSEAALLRDLLLDVFTALRNFPAIPDFTLGGVVDGPSLVATLGEYERTADRQGRA